MKLIIIIGVIIFAVFGYYVNKGYKGDIDTSKKKLLGYEKVGGLFRTLGWLSLLSGIVFGFLIFTAAESMPEKIIGAVIIFFILPILYLPLGKAIRDHKPWGRTVGNIVGVVSLIGVPIGTLIGLYVLIVMNKSWDDQPGKVVLDNQDERLNTLLEKSDK